MIEEVGVVAGRVFRSGNLELRVTAPSIATGLSEGESVAVNGVCLTVTALERDGFRAQVSRHTIENSTLGELLVGRRVNLERALRVGDRFGGHLVQGHVDGQGKVARVQYGEGSTVVQVEAAPEVMRLLAPKGSVALDGVSLTIAEKTARWFKVMLVPFTLEHTCLGELKPGDRVNMETDLIIRWLADRFPGGEVTSEPETYRPGNFRFHLED